MALFTRPDSPFWWYYCEGTKPKLKVNTKVPVDAPNEEGRKKNKASAQLLYNARMGDLARARENIPTVAPKPKGITFRVFVDWYTEHVLPGHRGAEREREILPRLVDAFGHMELTAIRRHHVEEWITWRRAQTRTVGKRTAAQPSASTINREVDMLKGVLQAAVPAHLEASPIAGMKRLHAPTPKRRLMSADEEAKLLEVLAVDDKAFVLVGLDALIRLSDILDLRRRDDHGDALWVADPKAGGGFAVPVSSRLRLALDAVYAAQTPQPDDYIFARRRVAKTERDLRNGIRQMLEKGCKDAGLLYGRAGGGLTFHWATRRTGATRMLSRGANPGTVQKVGRWKTASIVLDIYHELIDSDARRAVESISKRDEVG